MRHVSTLFVDQEVMAMLLHSPYTHPHFSTVVGTFIDIMCYQAWYPNLSIPTNFTFNLKPKNIVLTLNSALSKMAPVHKHSPTLLVG